MVSYSSFTEEHSSSNFDCMANCSALNLLQVHFGQKVIIFQKLYGLTVLFLYQENKLTDSENLGEKFVGLHVVSKPLLEY